jgi:hypothetical protein
MIETSPNVVRTGIMFSYDGSRWRRQAKVGWWLTRDGREMPIGTMSDSHLKNTIAMIERGRNTVHMQSLPRLYLERGIRRLKGVTRGRHERR